jgi:hypothetical protein
MMSPFLNYHTNQDSKRNQLPLMEQKSNNYWSLTKIKKLIRFTLLITPHQEDYQYKRRTLLISSVTQ